MVAPMSCNLLEGDLKHSVQPKHPWHSSSHALAANVGDHRTDAQTRSAARHADSITQNRADGAHRRSRLAIPHHIFLNIIYAKNAQPTFDKTTTIETV